MDKDSILCPARSELLYIIYKFISHQTVNNSSCIQRPLHRWGCSQQKQLYSGADCGYGLKTTNTHSCLLLLKSTTDIVFTNSKNHVSPHAIFSSFLLFPLPQARKAFSAPYPQTPKPYVLTLTWETMFYAHTKGKFIVLYLLTFVFLDS